MWSYSGNPATSDLDEVRFWCQDTDGNEPILPDEEINFIIDMWKPLYTSMIYVAAVTCEVIAGKFAREVAASADGVNISGDQLQQKYNDLALSLRDQYKALANASGVPDVGGILFNENFDSSIKPLVWSVGMHDNFRAGQQDFGGELPNAVENTDFAGAPGESRP